MSKYNFNERVVRKDAGSLKETMTPEYISKEGLVSYWGAEFDFPSCPAFSEGVRKCAERGLYAFTVQNKEYNQHVKWWMEHVRHWKIHESWIVPTHGTIFALATAIRLLLKNNERIIVFQPAYNRYEQAAARMGYETVRSVMNYVKEIDSSGKLTGHYEINFVDLEEKMSNSQNKLLVLCNPHNPTGKIADRQELQRIAELSEKYKVPVFCDEIFAEIVLHQNKTVIPYGEIAGKNALAMTCTSLGKAMSLTGINHANLIILNDDLREAYEKQKYADHYGSIDPMLYAGLMNAYTLEGQEFVTELCHVIRTNVKRIKSRFYEVLPQARVIEPEGTYVIWIDYENLGLDDEKLEVFLHKEAMFFGDNGEDYGAGRQFYRYSIAVPPEELEKSMKYLERASRKYGFIE